MQPAKLLRWLPSRLADSAYWRLYSQRQCQPAFASLFQNAPLKAAADMSMTLSPSDHMHGMIAFTGAYERNFTRRLRERALRGGTLVDVGANYGYFTLIWASANPANRVLAIEASPRNLEPLKMNVARNGLAGRVEIIGKAAGARHGLMSFDLGGDAATGWGGLTLERTAGTVACEVVPLDDICSGLQRIDFLKVDVEGADTLVLEGARGLLGARKIRELRVELNDERMRRLGIARDEPAKLLRSYGYISEEHGADLDAVAPRD